MTSPKSWSEYRHNVSQQQSSLHVMSQAQRASSLQSKQVLSLTHIHTHKCVPIVCSKWTFGCLLDALYAIKKMDTLFSLLHIYCKSIEVKYKANFPFFLSPQTLYIYFTVSLLSVVLFSPWLTLSFSLIFCFLLSAINSCSPCTFIYSRLIPPLSGPRTSTWFFFSTLFFCVPFTPDWLLLPTLVFMYVRMNVYRSFCLWERTC